MLCTTRDAATEGARSQRAGNKAAAKDEDQQAMQSRQSYSKDAVTLERVQEPFRPHDT